MTEEAKKGPGRPSTKEPVREPVNAPVQANMLTGAVDASMWDDFVYTPSEGEETLRIPKELIPDGFDYQWITVSVYGQPVPQRQSRFITGGWREVPAMRHDGRWMPKGYQGCIEVGGLVLHERPLWISEKARENERQLAKGRIKSKEQQLAYQGLNVPGGDHPSALNANKMRTVEHERMRVPVGGDESYPRED